MTRKIAICMNCQEVQPIAAHGLCYTCYRREERAEENPWAAADKHNRAMLKAHGQLRKAVTAILNALDSAIAHFSEEDITTLRNICGSYLAAMATGLVTPKSEEPVNSEHDMAVNCSLEPLAETTVNSEQNPYVNGSSEAEAGKTSEQKNAPRVNGEREPHVNGEREPHVNGSQESGESAV